MANNLKFSTGLRNGIANVIINNVGGGARLRIYDGTQPANANTAITTQNLLAELICAQQAVSLRMETAMPDEEKRFWLHWHLPIRAHVGVDIDFTPTWYEWLGKKITWSLSNKPSWMSINATTGKITGAPIAEATHSSIVLTGTRPNGDQITATFTCLVDNSKFVFVSTTGNDSNGGTLASPKATVVGAMALLSNSVGKTIYIRGGTYTESYIAPDGSTLIETDGHWFEGKSRVASDFHQIRSYPGEWAVFNPVATKGGPSLSGKYAVISHLEINGGNREFYPGGIWQVAENTLVVDTVLANVDKTGSADNCAGLMMKLFTMTTDGAYVANRNVCKSNYVRSSPDNGNGAGILFYTDPEVGDSTNYVWILNNKCFDNSKGIKHKHHGLAKCIVQGNELFGNRVAGLQAANGVFHRNVIFNNKQMDLDPSTDNTMTGSPAKAYYLNNIFANTVAQSPYYWCVNFGGIDSALGQYFERNIVHVTANPTAPILRLWEYHGSWTGYTININSNCYYTTDATPFVAGGGSPSGNLTFTQWKSKTDGGISLDPNSVNADPAFSAPTTGGFTIASDSPAADVNGWYCGPVEPTRTFTGLGQTNNTLTDFNINEDVEGAGFADAPSGGVVTLNPVTPDTSANASGTATWFRLLKSDGTTVICDGTVGTATSDMIFNSTNISAGASVALSSGTITVGNA